MRGKRVRTRSGSRWRRSRVTGPAPARVPRARWRAPPGRAAASSSVNRSPCAVAQVRALAAHRLRDQEARRARHGQRGGMELHELHVEQARPRRAGPWPCRRRWPPAGSWSPRTPGPRRPWPAAWPRASTAVSLAALVEEAAADHAPVRDHEVGRAGERAHRRRRRCRCAFSSSARTISQPVASPSACSTRLRECAPSRVKWKRPVLAVEAGAPGRQLADALRPLLDQHARRGRGDDAGARAAAVSSRCRSGVVVGAHRHRHPALGVAGVALGGLVLGHHQHRRRAGPGRGPRAGRRCRSPARGSRRE